MAGKIWFSRLKFELSFHIFVLYVVINLYPTRAIAVSFFKTNFSSTNILQFLKEKNEIFV